MVTVFVVTNIEKYTFYKNGFNYKSIDNTHFVKISFMLDKIQRPLFIIYRFWVLNDF
jgi:hypothetical protein